MRDLAVVVATTDRSRGRDGIAMFLVEPGAPGFQRGGQDHVMGLRGVGTGELVFADCRILATRCSAASRTVSARHGVAQHRPHRHRRQALGVAQAALDAAVAYAKTRVAFRRPIADLQAIQFMLADMSAQVEGVRLLVRRAALLKDHGRPLARAAAEAKLMAAERR